jgi:nucleoid-associated protein YgaU
MLESAETFKADSRIMSTSSHQSARADANAYPWGWLGVLGTVIVMMITGAGWLYQKNGEWPVPATQDPRNAALERTPAAAATPSDQGSVAESVRNPSDVASPPSLLTPSTPPMQSGPAVAEPSAAPEPDPPLPETVDTEADRGSYRAGTDAPSHAPPPVGTPPAGTYTIQRGDTLIAIAAHFFGDASQWSVIAEANPEADPRRLRVGQEIKLPPHPSPSR